MKTKKRKLGTVKFGNAKIRKKETKPKKILSAEEREQRKLSLYRIPTTEELTELRENENLYKNNLFRMQIKYLLDEVCLTDKKEKRINDVLHSLNSFLKGLPEDKECHISNCIPNDVCLPLPPYIQKEKVKCKFQFFSPLEVKIVGSFLLKTLIKSGSCIDVAVEIPKSCLQPRDCLNFRYHFKRASYLACIASSLKSWEYTDSVSFISENDPYMPIILLKVKGRVGKKYSIKLLTKIPDDIFKFSQLSPLRNNVRSGWFNDLETKTDEGKEFPTPHYNSSILSDMLHESHLQVIYTAMNECPGMKEAICLFKLWLKQRSFKGVSSFSSFIGAMLMCYLLSIQKISVHMSSYQIFRIVLHYIASSDWCTNGVTLCKNDDQDEQTLINFHASFDVVFVDPTGHLNLCANVDKIMYDLVKYQAKLSLDVLDDSTVNSFDGLFIKYHDFMQSVDQSFTLKKLDGFGKYCLEGEQQKLIDHGGNWSALIPKVVSPIIQKGLDKRIYRLIWKPVEMFEWCVSSPPPSVHENTFWFGLDINTEFSNNVVVMGPPADQPDAKGFRSFWGEKSELRRFQDGSINEAVLWPCGSSEEKMLISERIIKHLLSLHCHVPESSIKYHAAEFNCILKVNKEAIKSKHIPGCGLEERVHFLKNFDELCKQLHSLENIPLKIKSIDGIDSSFRLTQTQFPLQYQEKKLYSDKVLHLPKINKKCLLWPVNNAVIQFETCGKWPDDVKAIQHIKSAFHVKLANCIQTQLNMVAIPSPSFVDVMKNGYVFRLYVGHYREMVLCNESDASGVLKKEHEFNGINLDIMIVKKPLHTSLIHSLNSRYHSFALTVRLVKRWIASQMLGDYLIDEAIELIVASIFISPVAIGPPNSHMCGFLRFLNLLAKFDWKNEPLIVNLNEEITTEDNHSIRENFTSNRSRHPPIFISAPYSKNLSIWTKNNPTQQILLRLSLLADSALTLCNKDPDELSHEFVKQVYRPLNDYNVIIELNKSYVPLHYMTVDSSSSIHNSGIKENLSTSSLPVVDFNPPELYLKELRDAFSDVAMFFYDKYGGLKIGVVWKHGTLVPQNFKILNAQYKMIEQQKKTKKKKKKKENSTGLSVVPNIKAIISDFYIMGKGLVSNIEEI